MRCDCGGTIRIIKAEVQWKEDVHTTHVIKNVPAQECDTCDETIMDNQTNRLLGVLAFLMKQGKLPNEFDYDTIGGIDA